MLGEQLTHKKLKLVSEIAYGAFVLCLKCIYHLHHLHLNPFRLMLH